MTTPAGQYNVHRILTGCADHVLDKARAILAHGCEGRARHAIIQAMPWKRITFNPDIMGGKACIRGMRVTVSTVVSLLAAGRSETNILELYPYLETEDIREALSYAAWRAQEQDLPISAA